MLLTFTGKGCALNPQLGSNSAYYKAGSSLLLFDCGCDVFSKLVNVDPINGSILDEVIDITILITHMHDDHIGSLGSLLAYCKYVVGIKVKIIYPNAVDLSDALYKMGVRNNLYEFIECRSTMCVGVVMNDLAIIVRPIETDHFRGMLSYGYYVTIGTDRIFYSGDSRSIPKTAMELLTSGEITEFYQDISGRIVNPNEYWPHMKFGDLEDVIDLEFRSKFYLMHQDVDFVAIKQSAIDAGFGVV